MHSKTPRLSSGGIGLLLDEKPSAERIGEKLRYVSIGGNEEEEKKGGQDDEELFKHLSYLSQLSQDVKQH